MKRLLNYLPYRRRRLEQDLARELAHHLAQREDDLRAEGVAAPEAARRARLELGGAPQVQEAVRDTWVWGWLDDISRDLRHAVRGLIRNWGFTAGAGAVLTTAIGATVAMFTVVHSILLQPLPYPQAARLVALETLEVGGRQQWPAMSGPDFADVRDRQAALEVMAAYYGNPDDAVVVDGRPAFADDVYVSPEFFGVFGQSAAAGRLLSAADVPAGETAPRVAVVAHAFATTYFGSAVAALQQTITVYDVTVTIVGVAAPGFRYPGKTDIWIPDGVPAGGARDEYDYQVVGRRRADVTIEQAAAELRAIGDDLATRHPGSAGKTVRVIPLADRVTGGVHVTLWLLLGGVGLVWLIACANVANLVLTRGIRRSRELALRAALGAGRRRVVRYLVIESAILCAAAGAAAIPLAHVLVQFALALTPASLPRSTDVRLDGASVAFAAGLSLLSTLLVAAVPVFRGLRQDAYETLRQGGSQTTSTPATARVRGLLVVAEIALSVVLLTAGGQLVQSFLRLDATDLGFNADGLLVAYTEYAVDGEAAIRRRGRDYAEVLQRLRATPGVEAAAGVSYLGMGREPRSPRAIMVEGEPPRSAGEHAQAEYHAVTGDFFKTLQVPLVAGRDFTDADTADTPLVALVNEALVRSALGGASPLGRRIRSGTTDRAPWLRIVGVVGDMRWQDPSRPAAPALYAASLQGAGNSLSLVVRYTAPTSSVTGALRALLHEVSPTVPVKFERMADLVDATVAYTRLRAVVIGLFAVVATVLAAIGMSSVLAHTVSQRARELAVRRALGASASDIAGLVTREAIRHVALGLALGLVGSAAVSRALSAHLYQVGPWDPPAYLWTMTVLVAASAAATALPTMRSLVIAPLTALREE